MDERCTTCRVCESKELEEIYYLGNMAFTGIFPKASEKVQVGPLTLIRCGKCGLVQGGHHFDPNVLYGPTYGYRSGLNKSMINHLEKKMVYLRKYFPDRWVRGSVVDIGSSDGTFLNLWGGERVGFDPQANRFSKYYDDGIMRVPHFFTLAEFDILGVSKAKIVTTIAMFYDLRSPVNFVEDIRGIMDKDGIWHTEQSYLPLMIKNTAYDTICHEHLSYYGINDILNMAKMTGMIVVNIQFNDINGGSFATTLCRDDHPNPPYQLSKSLIETLAFFEREYLENAETWTAFRQRIAKHRSQMLDFFQMCRKKEKLVLGLGASTKGNVVLQYCGVSVNDLPGITDVNEDKWNKYTPGTHIPIISEEVGRGNNPAYFLVLPWHFRDNIIEREKEFLSNGGSLVFPLPKFEIFKGAQL